MNNWDFEIFDKFKPVVVCSLHKIYSCKTLITYLAFLHYLYYWADVRSRPYNRTNSIHYSMIIRQLVEAHYRKGKLRLESQLGVL
jgi:hypothetical protein